MEISKIIRNQIAERGISQTWVVNEVNLLDETICLTNNKLSAMLSGKRKIAGEEFIALCVVLNLDTSIFFKNRGTEAS